MKTLRTTTLGSNFTGSYKKESVEKCTDINIEISEVARYIYF